MGGGEASPLPSVERAAPLQDVVGTLSSASLPGGISCVPESALVALGGGFQPQAVVWSRAAGLGNTHLVPIASEMCCWIFYSSTTSIDAA